ncbi:WD40 repeat-like protein [Byssothecium circinans]|uniref:WD40 repeat-like protein n=1 Tax=Byssothecium circinans TaxID=147558 RepID=A0A6A5T6Q2_9PLEO|nr:WD40 repeat-like protein [Byssothecium circinans]KAF1959015.1 WD40 repeat-like protein [Byssothecium circinans]
MKNTVFDRLLKREVAADRKRYAGIAGIYGDRRWVQDLDIVNELEGHVGCVNALSWSRSGRLLASGSDDHHINIHSYHPESSTSQFSLTTSIITGHTTNIFSVKFMPYSNDRTIVSATDDVRIFDIEHSGHSALYGASSSRQRGSSYPVGIHGIPDGLTLTQTDTNAKAFRCHTDTVKRIVTEDNPFYFLTCSEDGDVRQWDIRQPSKAYPPRRNGSLPSWAADSEASDNVPAPLISYSKYHLDLNTVSCSPSQPHYIALGGAHLHCFLHDRRMLGRDKLDERGAKLASPSNWSEGDDEVFGKATRCVKKFAKNGKQRMRRADNGHITACKISDANPNELVVSWSGDHIYSFDILRSPDASEEYVEAQATGESSSRRRVKDNIRKRKRPRSSTVPQEDGGRASRQRTDSEEEDLALRVNYGNGQSEEIRIQAPQSPLSSDEAEIVQNTDHYRIAKFTVQLQKIFHLTDSSSSRDDDQSNYTPRFTSLIGHAASILPDMDEISRTWRYPVNPTPIDVALQNKLRESRASSRRFVQAAGTLARVLGGQLRTGGNANAIISQYFASIQPAPNERSLPRNEQFGYDFLKAILLWLDSGLGALISGFSSPSSSSRLPLPPDADVDAIDEILIPYLLQLASDSPIVNVDANRFESDETRIFYSSEKAAVIAFSRALKTPFADLTGEDKSTVESAEEGEVQDRAAAVRRWAFQIGRGVLLNASKGIWFSIVDRAYCGSGIADASLRAEEAEYRRLQEDIDPLEDDESLEYGTLIDAALGRRTSTQSAGAASSHTPTERVSSEAPLLSSDIVMEEDDDQEHDEGEESDGDIEAFDPVDDDDEDVDEDGLSRSRSGRILWRSDFDRSFLRQRVESDVPCIPHTRVFRGHCNIRTVKDVNYFGQQDEYVVSGSDCGHVFIWDRKTGDLVNILEGDGEIVNVVQGHPYEPLMAVSGIDHTIKVFSPDANDQRNARKGIGVHSADPGFSSIHLIRRRRRQREQTAEPTPSTGDPALSDDEDNEVEGNGLRSRRAMHRAYEITSENDMNRKGGDEEAFITRALLAQLSQRAQAHRQAMGLGDEDGDGEEGTTVLLNSEDCSVM